MDKPKVSFYLLQSSNKVGQLMLKSVLEGNPDLIIASPEYGNALDHKIKNMLKESNVPAFVTTAQTSNSREYYKDHGFTSLEVSTSQINAVKRVLETIVERYGKEDVIERTQKIFDSPNYFEKKEFIDLIIRPELKEYADSLENKNERIIIDAGHIDSKNFAPSWMDFYSFEDGLILKRYLENNGHNDVKIGILFNELQHFQYFDKTTARRCIKNLRKEIKKSGSNSLLYGAYYTLMMSYGFDMSTWKDTFIHSFEGHIIMKMKQMLEDGTGDFKTDLKKMGEKGLYFENDNNTPIILTTENGTPKCSFLSGGLNLKYEEMEFDRALYLRDSKWMKAISCGKDTAKHLFGVNLNIDSFLYNEIKEEQVLVNGNDINW